jgi:hypothetical protein
VSAANWLQKLPKSLPLVEKDDLKEIEFAGVISVRFASCARVGNCWLWALEDVKGFQSNS